MSAFADQWLHDLSTELAARSVPGSWVEAYPHEVYDAGHVGGDIQATNPETGFTYPAWARRLVWFDSASGKWWVIEDSYFLAECDHDVDCRGADPDRCEYCGPLTWIGNQCEIILCSDFRDPGGTEEFADYIYDDSSGVFDWQMTDAYAKQCASRLRPELYGAPSQRMNGRTGDVS